MLENFINDRCTGVAAGGPPAARPAAAPGAEELTVGGSAVDAAN